MKPRKVPKKHILKTAKIPYTFGPYHSFWFFREGERAYNDYWDLLPRKDAPVRLSDDIVLCLMPALKSVVSINPSNPEPWLGYSLNHCGLTVINRNGAAAFGSVCRNAAQEWARETDPLVVTRGTYAIMYRGDGRRLKYYPYRFRIARDSLVGAMETLADWGEKAATGEFYILHLGI